MKKKLMLLLLVAGLFSISTGAQQIADTSYNPSIISPEYKPGNGPSVFIDEGHNNFHTADGRYLPFARLLRSDGYRVTGYKGEFTLSGLKNVRILVIANALNTLNIENWFLPTPSAFTNEEIGVLTNWVNGGGSLFLIADHMPMGGAAANLAANFGFRFTNGFAIDTTSQGPVIFKRSDRTLLPCTISDGRNENEKVNSVATFTGQAFVAPEEATSVLTFDNRYLLLESDTAWIFNSHTRRTPIEGWSQGAYMNFGKGRIVFFGEAAMFTAQLAGPQQIPTGMNSEIASENYKLLLNIIHWLDRRFD